MRVLAVWLTLAGACGEGGGATAAAADAAPAAADAGPCTIYPQSGCAADETCALRCDGNASAQLCRSANPAGTQGHLCPGGSTDCAADHICIGEGDLRVCRRFCQDDGACVAPGGKCIPLDSVVCGGNPVPPAVDASFCTESCDPLDAAACATGLGCQIALATGGRPTLTYCTQAGTRAEGVGCLSSADCAAGTTCAAGMCRRWCVVGQACDVANRTCQAYSPTPAMIGSVEYGRCLP
jgi:hypothetical protein